MAWYDYLNPLTDAKKVTNAVGLTNPAAPDISKTPAAQDLSRFAGQLTSEYKNRTAGTAPVVTAPTVDTTQSDQARGIQQNTIGGLQGVASGGTNTAADALLTKGTDAASRQAMGTAATYSAANPGEALRMGLAAGGDAANKAASDAAILKANEQADARAKLVDAATAMRTGDTNIATTNAANTLSANQGNQSANILQQQTNNTNDQNLRTAAETGLIGAFAPTSINSQNQLNNQAANSTAIGGLIGTAGKMIASDERLKTDIRDGSKDADSFLASLSPRSWEWKDPGDPRTTGPGQKLGTVVQEMRPQDTAVGADGTGYISPDVITKMLAGMGRLHERVAAVEGTKDDGSVRWGPSPYPKEPPPKPITMPERR